MTGPRVYSKSCPMLYLCVDIRCISLLYIVTVHTQHVQNVQSCIIQFPYFCCCFSFIRPFLSLSVCLVTCLSFSLSLDDSPPSPPHQAKVRELEEKCRSQSEQFNLLSKELEKFRLQAGKFDILSNEPLTLCESPGSPNKSLSQLLNGLAAPIGKGGILIMFNAQ